MTFDVFEITIHGDEIIGNNKNVLEHICTRSKTNTLLCVWNKEGVAASSWRFPPH